MKYHFRPQKHTASFDDITRSFPQKLVQFNPVEKAFPISRYFGEGVGKKSALKDLYADGHVAPPEDFKGIYIFMKNRTPIYTGISKGVIGRILQHTKGHSHHTASFAFSLARKAHQKQTGDDQKIARQALHFKTHVGPAKAFLLQQKIAFMRIEDDYELYLFEVYCAMELETLIYNSFSSH